MISGIAASKTGYTDLAGGNLAVIFEIAPMHPIAISVLGSSTAGRFADVRKLAETAVKYFGAQEGGQHIVSDTQ
jgi:D-alanyl-D-alanine carboxypeptidase